MAGTEKKTVSQSLAYSVAFEEKFVWVSFFEGEKKRRAVVTITNTKVTEEAPFNRITTDPELFPLGIKASPSETSSNYTVTNVDWRIDQGAYYTKIETEVAISVEIGEWVKIENQTQ